MTVSDALRRWTNRARDLAFLPGTAGLWRGRLHGKVLCLLYHRVAEAGRIPWLDRAGVPRIAPGELYREVAFLKEQKARFGTFRDLRNGWWPGEREFGVIVCFDDGFKDTYENGLEVLENLGVCATIFQTASMIAPAPLLWEHEVYWYQRDPGAAARFRQDVENALGEGAPRASASDAEFNDFVRENMPRPILYDVLQRARGEQAADDGGHQLDRQLYPTAEDLEQALERGHEIGSHGDRHHPRSLLDDREFEDELRISGEKLSRYTGERPLAFSYPFGDHCDADSLICARHYAQAAIVRPEPMTSHTRPHEIPRCSWPGNAKNGLRFRRWLLTGRI